MTREQLFVAEPEFQRYQQVIGFGDTDHSGAKSLSYCICEPQAERADGLGDFNTAKCNLTQSTQFCSESSPSAVEPLGAFYNSDLHRKKRSVSSLCTTESSGLSDSDDVFDFRPLTYHDDDNNTNEVVCHYIDNLVFWLTCSLHNKVL